MSGLEGLADVARQGWREHAECQDARMPDGSIAEFVDVADIETAEFLVRRYCHRCPVLSDCNSWADGLRPERWLSVYGGRVHGIGSSRKRRAS